ICEQQHLKRHLAIGFTTLGHVMLQAGRYDEARECFDSSLRAFPGRGSGYRSVAELHLLRGDDPVEALRWAKLGIEHEQADRQITPDLRKTNLGEHQAILAWATAAASKDHAAVARLIAEAVEGVAASSVATRAQVHYHSGRAHAELGDSQASAQHYREAAKLDSHRNWGRAADAALK